RRLLSARAVSRGALGRGRRCRPGPLPPSDRQDAGLPLGLPAPPPPLPPLHLAGGPSAVGGQRPRQGRRLVPPPLRLRRRARRRGARGAVYRIRHVEGFKTVKPENVARLQPAPRSRDMEPRRMDSPVEGSVDDVARLLTDSRATPRARLDAVRWIQRALGDLM